MNRKRCASLEDVLAKRQKTSVAPSNTMNILGLNTDCMREIFKQCNCADLFQLCNVNRQMRDVVLECGVPEKMINFGELVHFTTANVFKVFGKAMSKIKIAERNLKRAASDLPRLEEILRLITTHCVPGKIECLELEYNQGSKVAKRFVLTALPFLRRLVSLSITEKLPFSSWDHPVNSSIDDFIDHIVTNAVTIRSINLKNVPFAGTFFHVQHVRNLESLVLENCYIRSSADDGFAWFMKSKPKLKSLSLIECGSDHELEMAANNIPNLEELQYENSDFDATDVQLRKFKKLKKLSIENLSSNILDVLVQNNSVQELRVVLCCDDSDAPNSNIANYTQLKYLDVSLEQAYGGFSAFLDWIPQFPCLTKLTLRSNDFDFLVAIELYCKLMASHTPRRKPLNIYIRNVWVARLVALLGKNYDKNLMPIRGIC